MEALPSLVDWLKSSGLAGIAGVIIWSGYKGYWVWGSQIKASDERYERMLIEKNAEIVMWRTRADKWVEFAMTQASTIDKAVTIVERKIPS